MPTSPATETQYSYSLEDRGKTADDILGVLAPWVGITPCAMDGDRAYSAMRMFVVGALADIQATDDIGKHFIEDNYGADAHWVAERIVQWAIPEASPERVEEDASAIEASVARILDELWKERVIERVVRETVGVAGAEMPTPDGGHRYRIVGPQRMRTMVGMEEKSEKGADPTVNKE